MRAFRYRLAAALRQAEYVESRRQLELAQREEALTRAEAREAQAEQRRAQQEALLREALAKGEIEVGTVESAQREVELAEAQVEGARRAVGEARAWVEEARERLVLAAVQRRKFEKHREGRAEAHRREAARAEMAHLDELANAHRGARRAARGELEGC